MVFASVYLQANPHKVQEILKYGNIIRSAANKYTGFGWREYDIQFRTRGKNKNNSWATIDGELWLLHVVGGGSPKLGAAGTQFQASQMKPGLGGRGAWRPQTQPVSQFRGPGQALDCNNQEQWTSTQQSVPRQADQPGICFRLNFGPGKCERPHCRYLHKCIACGSPGHGKVTCTKSQDPTGSQSAK